MIPRPPALLTALASCERAIQPMGACTMGYLVPNILVIRLSIIFVPNWFLIILYILYFCGCLGSMHDRFMGEPNNEFWDRLKLGS